MILMKMFSIIHTKPIMDALLRNGQSPICEYAVHLINKHFCSTTNNDGWINSCAASMHDEMNENVNKITTKTTTYEIIEMKNHADFCFVVRCIESTGKKEHYWLTKRTIYGR